jgi:putative hydrolase of the HAD superfamily
MGERIMAVRFVFFDIGDVLFDEDVPHLYYFHSLLLSMRRNGVDVSWDEYHARVQSIIRKKPENAPLDAIRFYVADDNLYDKIYREGRKEYEQMRKPRPYGLLLDNIAPAIKELHSTFKLGIIANQHPEILGALRDYGIAHYFDVVAIDQIIGVSKPDPALFQWALDKAGCSAKEAIMVGDRPDVDIAPAKKLGFATIRFRRGLYYSLYDAQSEEERADFIVYDTGRLPQAVRTLAEECSGDSR